MQLNTLLDFCAKFSGVEETFPFDNQTLVLKVGGKMFLLVNIQALESINLKCNPDRSPELRETYSGIQAGYHMNKTHWNTISLNDDVPTALIYELITHSYELVVASLPKRIRDELAG
jgi:predicted DNA-binding protein (MmcQ/YjbR family)